MASVLNRLTALQIGRMTQKGYFADGGGLYLVIKSTGGKSWVFRYDRQGKRHEIGLGGLKTVSLQTARTVARECRQQIIDGIDPLVARQASLQATALEAARAVTFDECVKSFVKAHRDSWKNAKHIQQWENTLRDYASPKIGKLSVAAVDTTLVRQILDPIWKSKTVTAKRVRARIEAVLDWAKVAGYRTGDNPARWKGHLDVMLASPSKVTKAGHFAALPWGEVGKFLADLRRQDGIAARGVELAILTATRSGEIRGATWDEFDLDAALWTIPATRMKAGKEHRVPLSKQAVSLLEKIPRNGDYVFHGAKQGKPLSDMSLTAVLRRMGRDDITVHGFRSTFRDWCAEASNFPRTVAEHALAHKLPDKVEAAYQRGDLLAKRTSLMTAWANYCDRIKAANVIDLARGGAYA